MSGIINIGDTTKPSHTSFVGWLNGLLNNYQNGFWDDAVKNLIQLTFIRTHNLFMQELYQGDCRTLSSFMTVLPTDSVSSILMIHNLEDGKPWLYNSENWADLFEFNARGFLVRFFENVTIDLLDSDGVSNYECFITFEDFYGIKAPMYIIKQKGTNAIVGKGLVDILYEGRYSGTYAVEDKPLDNYPFYKATNETKGLIVTDIPILTNLSIRYEIKSGSSIYVPITEWTTKYFKDAKELNSLSVKKVG